MKPGKPGAASSGAAFVFDRGHADEREKKKTLLTSLIKVADDLYFLSFTPAAPFTALQRARCMKRPSEVAV